MTNMEKLAVYSYGITALFGLVYMIYRIFGKDRKAAVRSYWIFIICASPFGAFIPPFLVTFGIGILFGYLIPKWISGEDYKQDLW